MVSKHSIPIPTSIQRSTSPRGSSLGESLVERIYPFASSQLKAIGREIQQAEITCRNFPLRPEALRSRLRLKDGGTKTLLALTVSDGAHHLVLCHRL